MLPRTLRRGGAALSLALATLGTLLTGFGSANAAPQACNGYVGLTYDDGPHGSMTRPLLDALRAAGARATFFTVGRNAQQYPDLLRTTQSAGMWIGNHTYTHPHLTQLSRQAAIDEITRTQQVVQQTTGQTPTLFRPPYGETNTQIRSDASARGLTHVLWSVDSRDWAGASTDQIVQAASGLQAGGIILMHEGYQSTINAVPRIVQNLRARGLCPGRVVGSNGNATVVAP